MINIPKGTKDVLPGESYKWHFVEGVARGLCMAYGYREIRTPAFEYTQLFTRSIGEDTDVAGKEMYTFLDKGNRSITLKPEGTAPVARAYIENNLESESLPLKMYYFTPVFRYERPQAGRLREHHQFGVEVYGGDSAYLDYEVIELAYHVLNTMLHEKGGIELHMSSIGCPGCRQAYNEILKSYLRPHLDGMCETCRDRFERNPLRIIDCKVPSCKQIAQNAPKIYDYICEPCKTHMQTLTAALDRGGIPYKIDKDIVRGLDYYTKTVFEFVTTHLGAQGTVCGGGRYNTLVESVGGKPTPCVGFGMGLERLLLLMDELGIVLPDHEGLTAFVVAQSPKHFLECMQVTRQLRHSVFADMDYTDRSFKAQMKYADKRGAKYAVIIGDTESETGEYTVKNMQDGTSDRVHKDKLTQYFNKRMYMDAEHDGYSICNIITNPSETE